MFPRSEWLVERGQEDVGVHRETLLSVSCSPLSSHVTSDKSLGLLSLSFLTHKAWLIVLVSLRKRHVSVKKKTSSAFVRRWGRNEFNKCCVSV